MYITSFRKWFVEPNDTEVISMPSMGSCVNRPGDLLIHLSWDNVLLDVGRLEGISVVPKLAVAAFYQEHLRLSEKKAKKSVSFAFGQHCSLLKMTLDENAFFCQCMCHCLINAVILIADSLFKNTFHCGNSVGSVS